MTMKVKIKKVTDFQMGYQFREKLATSSTGDYRVIQAKDISQAFDHRLDLSNLHRVMPKRDAEKYRVKNGDVIFLSKGRRNYATLISKLSPDLKTIVAGYFFVIRPKTQVVIPEYIAWIINQPPAQSYLKSVSRGSGMPFIPKTAFANLEIPIPSIDVQKQIVKLYELSFQESILLKQLEEKRSKLISKICIEAAKQKQEM